MDIRKTPSLPWTTPFKPPMLERQTDPLLLPATQTHRLQFQQKFSKILRQMKVITTFSDTEDLLLELLYTIQTFTTRNLLHTETDIKLHTLRNTNTLEDKPTQTPKPDLHHTEELLQIPPTALTPSSLPGSNIKLLQDLTNTFEQLQTAHNTSSEKYTHNIIDQYQQTLWTIISHISQKINEQKLSP